MNLTAHQIRILQMIADGCDYPMIAERNKSSVQTVKNCMQDIFNRLGADNRAHAVAMAFRRGMVT